MGTLLDAMHWHRVKPPEEVFNEWTPEQQEAYRKQNIEPLYEERKLHETKLQELNPSGSTFMGYDESSDTSIHRQTQLALQSEDHPNPADADGVAGARLGNLVLFNSSDSGSHAKKEKARQISYEQYSIDIIDKQLEAVEVGNTSNQCPDNLEEIKARYKEEVDAVIASDKQKLAEEQQKLSELEEEYDNTWFIGKKRLENEIAFTKLQIERLKQNLAYNEQCLANTFPPPPPTPPVPTPLCQIYAKAGDKIVCPFAMGGTAALGVNPSRKVFLQNKPMANIMDFQPMVDIPSFGMCSTLSNPAVAAATSAAMGVLTPQPCVPVITGPWAVGKFDVLVEGFPALLITDKVTCAWGGVISFIPV